MDDTDAILDRLRTERQLAENGGHPILRNSFDLAIEKIEALRASLLATQRTNVWYLRAMDAEEKLANITKADPADAVDGQYPNTPPDDPTR